MWTLRRLINLPKMRDVANLPYEISVVLYLTKDKALALKEFDKIGTAEAVELPNINVVVKGCRDNKTNNIVLIHNHPPIDGISNPAPSDGDLIATRFFKKNLERLGINLLDHIILTKTSFFSFKENHLL